MPKRPYRKCGVCVLPAVALAADAANCSGPTSLSSRESIANGRVRFLRNREIRLPVVMEWRARTGQFASEEFVKKSIDTHRRRQGWKSESGHSIPSLIKKAEKIYNVGTVIGWKSVEVSTSPLLDWIAAEPAAGPVPLGPAERAAADGVTRATTGL